MADDRRSLPFRQSLDARAAARAAELGDNWEHMGEDARQALRQWIQAEDATEDLPTETAAAADNAELEKLRQTYDRVSDTELRATAEKMKRMDDDLLASKLRNIISGYRINEDDAGWLMGLLGRPRATAPAASAVALDWTDEQQAAIDWIAAGDTGMSSEAIWAHMAGSKMLPANGFGYAHPHDPGDLGRCLRLLAKVPSWSLRISEMAERSAPWAVLVGHWDELAKLLAEEIGEGWLPGWNKSAPRTYARMREILDLVEA